MPGGDYAAFIWSAYGFTTIAVTALILQAVLGYRRELRALGALEGEGSGPDA